MAIYPLRTRLLALRHVGATAMASSTSVKVNIRPHLRLLSSSNSGAVLRHCLPRPSLAAACQWGACVLLSMPVSLMAGLTSLCIPLFFGAGLGAAT